MTRNMVQHWIRQEPSLAFGVPVYIFAAILFPLHLGWIGASLPELAGYLVAAAMIFSLADVITHKGAYPKWTSVTSQLLLSLLALILPVSLAFTMGSIIGPIDEVYDESVCASRGSNESDSVEA
jgi:hypothetical protein